MLFSASSCLYSFLILASTILAAPAPVAEPAEVIELTEIVEVITGLAPICPNLNTTSEIGCIRYVKGFDVTGVVTEVDLTFPEIQDSCDCIQACLNRPTTCAAYVWKFSTPASVAAGHRTCTLYSQFNLPSAVTIVLDLANTTNRNINAAEIQANGVNPQVGAPVAQTFMDANLNTTADPDAVSGEVWQLSTGVAIC